MPEDEKQKPSTKPISIRLVLSLVIGILLIGVIGYAYFWFTSTQNKIKQAEGVIQKAAEFDALSDAIEKEQQRCSAFIAQEQGQFGEFQYCQGFINWVNTNASD